MQAFLTLRGRRGGTCSRLVSLDTTSGCMPAGPQVSSIGTLRLFLDSAYQQGLVTRTQLRELQAYVDECHTRRPAVGASHAGHLNPLMNATFSAVRSSPGQHRLKLLVCQTEDLFSSCCLLPFLCGRHSGLGLNQCLTSPILMKPASSGFSALCWPFENLCWPLQWQHFLADRP